MNARALGYSTAIDEEVLKPVTEHFTAVARQENLPIGRPVEYDAFHPIHQVPGGMISNFRFQLANLGKLDQLDAVLEEVVRVRAEFGYPIMVTPYSQFVGVQAAINVMVGERYKEITDEMIQYALGHWGEEEARSIDANVSDMILSRPRAKELAKWTRPEISVKEFRAKFGGDGVSDDEKLLRYFAGEDYVASMKATPPAKDYTNTATPLVTLISSLAQRKDTRQIFIQRKDFSLRLEQRSAVTASDNVSVGNAEAKSSS
jgi:oxaloacetate decarboxylase alpha subunit